MIYKPPYCLQNNFKVCETQRLFSPEHCKGGIHFFFNELISRNISTCGHQVVKVIDLSIYKQYLLCKIKLNLYRDGHHK